MQRPRICAPLLLLATLCFGLRAAVAADPVPYTVHIAPSGDGELDGLLGQTSSLIALQTKLPAAPFALIGRARADQAQFETVLESLGYDSGTVALTIDGKAPTDPTLLDALQASPSGAKIPILITAHPGPRFHLGTVTVTGLPAGFAPDLAIAAGEPARTAPILAASGALATRLRAAGYAFARVPTPRAVANEAAHTLDVTFTVDAGPRVDIGPIAFAGEKRTDPAFLARHIKLAQGQRYSPGAIGAARDDLLGLGVFSSVTAIPAAAPDAGGQVPITFRVVERKLHTVSLGASYATDTGISITTSWLDRNVFGRAETLTLSATANGLGGTGTTAPGYDAKAVFAKPDFFTRGQTLTLNVEALREFLTAYNRTALLAGASLSRPITAHLTATGGLAFVTEHVVQEGTGRNYVIAQLPLGLNFDTTNSLLEPTRGVRANLTITPSKPVVGGAGAFFITHASASTYIAVEPGARGIIALAGQIGVIAGASQFQVPPDQRFYAGGTGTVRGYTYQKVGPLFPDGIPEGGTAIDAGSIEFRQRLPKSILGGNLGVVPFVDVGQVSANAAPFTGTPRVGVGLGLRYYTPIGPIRADFAVPLSKIPGNESFALYIGLGEAF